MCLTLFLNAALPAAEPAKSSEKPEEKPHIRWKPLLGESLFFLGVENGVRVATQDYTRKYLGGPFFGDWGESIGNLHGWGDGDNFMTNYVGHPIQGAVAGFMFVQNDMKYQTEEFGKHRDYWKSRLRATLFSVAYSEEFELGPLSEASLGNAQAYYPQYGMVDHVITPVVGFGWMVAEDALDRYVITPMENRTQRRWVRITLRGVLNPGRSMANALRLQVPWYRDTRPGPIDAPSTIAPPQIRMGPGDPPPPPATPTFELGLHYSYVQLNTGHTGSLSCNGGGMTATYNVNRVLGFTGDIAGCKMLLTQQPDVSGDSLSYLVGPRFTFRNSSGWIPFTQFLAGGDKLSTETLYPDRKPPVTGEIQQIDLPALHSSYTSQAETNAFAIKFGAGLDRVVNPVLAIRVLDVENTHTWAHMLNGRHYPNNVSFSTGLVLRFGNW